MDKDKIQTEKFIYGSWKSIPDKVYPNYNGIIKINAKELSVLLFVNDSRKYKISIPSSAAWTDDYLCFAGDTGFYVLSANETEMIFGEFKNPAKKDGQHKWQLKFERIIE